MMMTGQPQSSGHCTLVRGSRCRPTCMSAEVTTAPVHIRTVLDAALVDMQLGQEMHDLAREYGWKTAAAMMGIAVHTARALAFSPSNCQRGTKALARQRLAEIARLADKGDAAE